jgi:putative membrane protein
MITSALSPNPRSFSENRLTQVLVAVYAAVWIWAAIDPVEFQGWMLENLLVVAAVALTVWLNRVRPLSDVSNIMCTIFMIFHTVGSHYTYSLVPFGDWLKEAGGFERNHYDRIIHFAFGLLIVYPLREVFLRIDVVDRKWLGFFAFNIIATCSGFYELIEWAAAAIVDPKAGLAFLGTQGDVFDAQKDHALALAGALITLGAVRLIEGPARAARP